MPLTVEVKWEMRVESVLTEGVATIRSFGRLVDATVECRTLVLLTANNATLRRDMLRRTLPVRLVVPDEKPELRRFDFDPVDEARRDRAELLAAAFTIAKAWHAARALPECSHIRAKTLGSFEVWAELVAGAVEWLTGSNPIDAVEARKGEDPAAISERAVIARLVETFDGSFTAAEAASQVEPATWREVLTFKAERPDGRVVGNWLQRCRDRAFSITVDDGKPPVIVTLEATGHDRKGFTKWSLAGAEPPNLAEPVQPYARKLAVGESDGGVVGGNICNQGPTASARFGGSAGSGKQNGHAHSELSRCAHCGGEVVEREHTATSSGKYLHNACVDAWSRQ
jgi:hypothetical protein